MPSPKMSPRNRVRSIKKMTRDTGTAHLIAGGTNRDGTRKKPNLSKKNYAGRKNRKALAAHLRHFKGLYKQQRVGTPMQVWPYK